MDTQGKSFTGTVTSDKMQSTIVVEISSQHRHPTYQKVIVKKTSIYADNNLKAKIGDTVIVRETRPLSKLKRFTTTKIVKSQNIN